jgi:hypothetical protein
MIRSILFLLLLTSQFCYGQIGGLHSFEFLRLPSSARATALGGSLTAVSDGDISLAWQNPAILDSLTHRKVNFNHNFHFAGITNGLVSYGHHIQSLGIDAQLGVQYINYGDFLLTDEIGTINGEFSGQELALGIGAAKQINERIRLGANLKFISSALESYNASGILIDLGIIYHKPNSNGSWAATFKNIGTQLSSFTDEKKSLPFDFQLSYSAKLKHLPFRYTITGQRLDRWDIRFDDPDRANDTDIFGETTEESAFSQNLDNFFRHFIISGEFLLARNEALRFRFGYNHLLRKELQVSSFRSLGGFSLGFGLKLRKFSLDYGVGYHHLAGATNHVGFSLNMGEFFKKV